MPKRKLADLAGLTPVSQTGLARIIDALRDGLPDSSSRRTISREIDNNFIVDTPYGAVMQTLDFPRRQGLPFSWTACHPGALLTLISHNEDLFSTLLRSTLASTPSTPASPWRIIIYFDEATVGDLLRVDHTREAWQIYWTFMEFPAQFLFHENN